MSNMRTVRKKNVRGGVEAHELSDDVAASTKARRML